MWRDENQNRDLSSPDAENNSGNLDVSPKNRGGKVYMHQSLCSYYKFLYGQVKERYKEGLFHDFWVTNGTLWIKDHEYSKPMDVSHISDL